MSFRLVDSNQSVRRLARSIASSIAKETFRLAFVGSCLYFSFFKFLTSQPTNQTNLVCLAVCRLVLGSNDRARCSIREELGRVSPSSLFFVGIWKPRATTFSLGIPRSSFSDLAPN